VNQIWLAFTVIAHAAAPHMPVAVQFVAQVSGKTVAICIDGGRVHKTFAGKLGFRDKNHAWTSVCAAVRKPIVTGQYTGFRVRDSRRANANVPKAGNIVARFFDEAKTPAQCAGLQLAVWEALEDGGRTPNFSAGRFQAQSDPEVMDYGLTYYTAIAEEKSAVYLESASGKSQSQLSSPGKDAIPPRPGNPDK
jgi:hypothetical protein